MGPLAAGEAGGEGRAREPGAPGRGDVTWQRAKGLGDGETLEVDQKIRRDFCRLRLD